MKTSVETEFCPFPGERILDLVQLSTMTFQHVEMTQHLAQVSLSSLDLCLARVLPRLKMFAAAGSRLLLFALRRKQR